MTNRPIALVVFVLISLISGIEIESSYPNTVLRGLMFGFVIAQTGVAFVALLEAGENKP